MTNILNLECNNCKRKYCSRRSLIRHIQNVHPEEIEIRTYTQENLKNYECNSCGYKFSTRRSLIRHWKYFHSYLVPATPTEKTWDCNECVKKYTNKFSLYKHKQLCHPNSIESIKRRLRQIFECKKCKKKYSYKRALYRHIQLSHPEEFTEIMASKLIVCHTCGKRYTSRNGYALHLKQVHAREPPRKRSAKKTFGYECPICRQPFEGKSSILLHFTEDHNFDFIYEIMEFDTRVDFDKWLMRVEEETQNSYSIRSSFTSGNNRFIIYSCCRSGHYQTESKGKRNVKKDSRKINGYCPAEIRLKITPDDRCRVQFVSTHVGHAHELAHMQPNNEKYEWITVELDTSVSEVSYSFTECKRPKTVTLDDMHRIQQKNERSLSKSNPSNSLLSNLVLREDTLLCAEIVDVENVHLPTA